MATWDASKVIGPADLDRFSRPDEQAEGTCFLTIASTLAVEALSDRGWDLAGLRWSKILVPDEEIEEWDCASACGEDYVVHVPIGSSLRRVRLRLSDEALAYIGDLCARYDDLVDLLQRNWSGVGQRLVVEKHEFPVVTARMVVQVGGADVWAGTCRRDSQSMALTVAAFSR